MHPPYLCLSLFGMLQVELWAVPKQFEINLIQTIKFQHILLLKLPKIGLDQIIWVHFADFVFCPERLDPWEKVVFPDHLELLLEQRHNIFLHGLDLQQIIRFPVLLANPTGVPVRSPVVPETVSISLLPPDSFPPDPHSGTVVAGEVWELCLGFEHKLSDEDWPADVLVGGLEVFGQLWVVDKLALKKSPASAVEDVTPRRKKTIKRMTYLSKYA